VGGDDLMTGHISQM